MSVVLMYLVAFAAVAVGGNSGQRYDGPLVADRDFSRRVGQCRSGVSRDDDHGDDSRTSRGFVFLGALPDLDARGEELARETRRVAHDAYALHSSTVDKLLWGRRWLNRAFYERIFDAMPEHVELVETALHRFQLYAEVLLAGLGGRVRGECLPVREVPQDDDDGEIGRAHV